MQYARFTVASRLISCWFAVTQSLIFNLIPFVQRAVCVDLGSKVNLGFDFSSLKASFFAGSRLSEKQN